MEQDLQQAMRLDSDCEEAPETTLLSLPQEYTALAQLLHGPREWKDQVTPMQALAKHRPGKAPPELARRRKS